MVEELIDDKLFLACLTLDIHQVECLIEKGGNPSALLTNKEADSTLHLVCGQLGHLDILKVLTTNCLKECDLKLRDKRGWTPLHHAVSYGHENIIMYLTCDLGCDPMLKGDRGETALHLACEKHLYLTEKVDIIKCLIEKGKCDVNATDLKGRTPLMYAARCQNSEKVVECLIYYCRCNWTLRDNEGNTALHFACHRKNVEALKHLIQRNVMFDIDARNSAGLSPLLLACSHEPHSVQNNILDLLNVLADAKCDTNVSTDSGETPVMLIAKWVKVECKKVLDYLVHSCECDLSATNKNGNTALHVACIANNISFVEALVGVAPCTVGIQNCDGDTPLHIACSQGNNEIVSIILSHSFGGLYTLNKRLLSPFQTTSEPEIKEFLVVNMCKKRDDYGNSPLHIACMNADEELFDLAAKVMYSSDLDLTNADGDTPLHIACMFGNLKFVKVLLGMNCSVTVKNHDGDNSILTALNVGKFDIFDHLERNIVVATSESISKVQMLLDNALTFHEKLSNDIQIKTMFQMLCYASFHNDPTRLSVIQEYWSKYQSLDYSTSTPLHYASYYGNLAIVKYLVNERLCEVDIKNINDETALHLACISPAPEAITYEIVTVLINNAESDYNEVNSDGLSPLMLAIKHSKSNIAWYLIVECHCDLTVKNLRGETALDLACALGNANIVNLIVESKFDSKDGLQLGIRPLQLACKHRHNDIVHIILGVTDYEMKVVLSILESCYRNQEIALELVKYLCQTQDKDGNNALHIYCGNGKSHLMKALLHLFNLNHRNDEGDAPLHIACSCGDSKSVLLLLSKQDCDIRVKNQDGDTPFDVAIRNEELFDTELLLKLSTNNIPNFKTVLKSRSTLVLSNFLHIQFPDSKNVFHVICGEVGDLDALKLTMEAFDCTHSLKKFDSHGQTPLHCACMFGNLNILHYLVTKQKCDPSVRNKWGETLLHVSCTSLCQEKALSFINFLINDCKVDCNASCNCGNTPLMLLLKSKLCMMNVIKLFIVNYQCNLSTSNHDGDTALHIATKARNTAAVRLILLQSYFILNFEINAIDMVSDESCHDQILKVLPVDISCGLHHLNNDLFIPVTLAETSNDQKTMSLLVHAMYKNPDKNGDTPLHTACRILNYHLVKKIIGMNCAMAMANNNNGDTPLHIACCFCSSEYINLFLQGQCDLQCQNNDGDTPIHVACKHNNEDVIRTIVRSDAFAQCSEQKKNSCGETPLQLAFQNNHLNIACLLITGHDLQQITNSIPLEESLVKLKQMIEQGVNPHLALRLKFYNSNTFLHVACGHAGDINVVRSLTSVGKGDYGVKDGKGWTPLHYACYYGRLDIVEYLVNELRCDASVQSYMCPTPLHLACKSNSPEDTTLKIVRFLTTTGRCNPNKSIYNGDTLLIYLLKTMSSKLSILQYLITEYRCNLLATASDGNTALHIACSKQTSNLHVIKMIASRGNSFSSIRNNGGSLPLHLACRTSATVVQTLIQLFSGQCGLYERNGFSYGYTPFQLTLLYDQEISKVLMKEMFIKPDGQGNTPLHLACKLEADYLSLLPTISDITTKNDVNKINSDGDTALHIACRSGNREIVAMILDFDNKLQEATADAIVDINAKNNTGDTPVHIACKSRNLQLITLLLSKRCDINSRDGCGNTLLHLACKECQIEVIKLLVNHPLIQINHTNNDGDTFLHVLCQSPLCSSKSIEYVLEVTHFDPNVKNKAERTPIQLTSDIDIIQELVRFGANPMESDHYLTISNRLQVDVKHPPPPVTKVFIVGNTSVGKSTLTAALQNESSNFFTSSKKVSGVEEKTAGIIPYDFDSKKYGKVTLHDFAGHRQYYSSHTVLLKNSIDLSTPIFLLVVNLRESYDDFKKNVLYWLSFLDIECQSARQKPFIVIVGSHADVLISEGEKCDDKEKLIQQLQSSGCTNVDIVGFVAMDCQYSHSIGMSNLRHYLKHCCNQLRRNFPESIRYNAHCFLVYLNNTFTELKAATFHQVLSAIKCDRDTASSSDPIYSLPSSFQSLLDLCYDLNDRGHILLLRDKQVPLNSWIIFDKKSLLNEVTGTIFAPEGLKQYCNLGSNTGVVPLSRLSEKFYQLDQTMLVNFLTHLEYCHEISDQEILQIIGEQIEDTSTNETYLFFPALVKLEAPKTIWSHKSHLTQHCGWLLKSSKSDQFFTSRFLEVLLLRLAFSFALVPASESVTDTDNPFILRKCSIWKNGIFWSNCDGIDTIVEVLSDNKVVQVVMRFSKTQLTPFLKLRSSVIQKVTAAVSDFCTKMEVSEYFIDPSDLVSYPICEPATLFDIKEITRVLFKKPAQSAHYVVPEVGTALPIDHLLSFEPYTLVHPALLIKLYDNKDATLLKQMPDFELKCLAENVTKHEHAMVFASLFNDGTCTALHTGSASLFELFKMWRTKCKGTYDSFNQILDQYSIYGGRSLSVSIYTILFMEY